MKKFLLATGFLLAATSASLAQGYGYQGYGYYRAPYAYGPYGPGYNLYDSAPGYGYGPGLYDYAPEYGLYWDYFRSDFPGRGNSAESQR
jgi:hypothetical protein